MLASIPTFTQSHIQALNRKAALYCALLALLGALRSWLADCCLLLSLYEPNALFGSSYFLAFSSFASKAKLVNKMPKKISFGMLEISFAHFG